MVSFVERFQAATFKQAPIELQTPYTRGTAVADATGVIGKGIEIKGTLSGAGDLIIEGRVEGQISLKNMLSTIEESQ